MFGYHDHDRCIFDLWSPVDDQCESLDTIYTHPHQLELFNHPCATENRAFSPYAKHQQELDDIVQISIQKFLSGESNFTLEVDDDFSEGDLAYIEKEIYRLLGE